MPNVPALDDEAAGDPPGPSGDDELSGQAGTEQNHEHWA